MPAVETAIWTALKARVVTISTSIVPTTSISWPNKSFDKPQVGIPAKQALYLVITHLPNQNERPWIGDDEPAWRRGILQLVLNYPIHLNHDLVVPLEMAGKIAAHFPVGLEMSALGVTARVDRAPDIAEPFKDEANNPAYWQLPVSVRYWCEA